MLTACGGRARGRLAKGVARMDRCRAQWTRVAIAGRARAVGDDGARRRSDLDPWPHGTRAAADGALSRDARDAACHHVGCNRSPRRHTHARGRISEPERVDRGDHDERERGARHRAVRARLLWARRHRERSARRAPGARPTSVAHGTRIDEDSYAELELRREDTFKDDIHTKVVTTLAFFPPFFHYSGEQTQSARHPQPVRNRPPMATGPCGLARACTRGDDFYLLDWWLLDNQNTVGGGVRGRSSRRTRPVAAHVGMERLDKRPTSTSRSRSSPRSASAPRTSRSSTGRARSRR